MSIMKIALSIAFVILLVISAVVGDELLGKGFGPHPANDAYSGCRLKSGPSINGCTCKSSPGIQMGETWANIRVQNQLSAFFVPFQPGEKNYDSEGGPYGTGTGCNCWPKEWDMEYSNNPADMCFFWKNDYNSENVNATEIDVPKLTAGEQFVPMPIVCPGNLNNCYAEYWYEPGGALGAYANWKPTYKGVWFPPKDPSTLRPLFCQGLNLGCPTPTNQYLTLHRLPGVCDVSRCSPSPYRNGTV